MEKTYLDAINDMNDLVLKFSETILRLDPVIDGIMIDTLTRRQAGVIQAIRYLEGKYEEE